MTKLGQPIITLQQLSDFLSSTSPEKVARFNELRALIKKEDCSIDDHQEFLKMRIAAAAQFNEAQMMKQLEFLASGDFTAADVIRAGKFSKKDVLAAIREVFAEDETKDAASLFKVNTNGVIAVAGLGRWPQSIVDEVKSWTPEQLASSLTESGRQYLSVAKIAKKGDMAGIPTYPNLIKLAERIGMDANGLKVAMGLE